MSSPSKSPTMESVQESHPHLKASVSQVNTSTGSPSPKQLQQVKHEADRTTEASLTRTQDAIVAAPSVGAEVEVVHQIPDEEEELNNFNNNLQRQQQDGFIKSFPPGFRFNPRDDELVVYYLQKKILNEPLPPNKIIEVNLYHHNPETLAERYETYGEKEWYFFTPRDRKYPNGHRPNRKAGDGYWKATGADKTIRSGKVQVGCRKALVFYRGRPPKGTKTNWIMHEYRVPDSPATTKKTNKGMRLDNWVLCRIYKKAASKSNKTQSSNHEPDHVEESLSTSLPDDMQMEMEMINGQVDDTQAQVSEGDHPHNVVQQPYGFNNSCPNYAYTYPAYSGRQSMFHALNNNILYDHQRFQPVPLSFRESYANMLQIQQTCGSSSPIPYNDQSFSLQFTNQSHGVQIEDQRFIVHPADITSESMPSTEEAPDQKCVVQISNQKLVTQSVDDITSGSMVCTDEGVYSDQKYGIQTSGQQYIEESDDDVHNFFDDPTFPQLGALWP